MGLPIILRMLCSWTGAGPVVLEVPVPTQYYWYARKRSVNMGMLDTCVLHVPVTGERQ